MDTAVLKGNGSVCCSASGRGTGIFYCCIDIYVLGPGRKGKSYNTARFSTYEMKMASRGC